MAVSLVKSVKRTAWDALIDAIEEDMETQCTVMFCIGDRNHEGDSHYDVTGYSWTAKAPANPVIAHVYSFGEDIA